MIDRGTATLRAAVAADAERIASLFTDDRPDARRFYESLGYDGTLTTYLRKRLGPG